jgi:hypothetical protein
MSKSAKRFKKSKVANCVYLGMIWGKFNIGGLGFEFDI